jgi:hypothetical protein
MRKQEESKVQHIKLHGEVQSLAETAADRGTACARRAVL